MNERGLKRHALRNRKYLCVLVMLKSRRSYVDPINTLSATSRLNEHQSRPQDNKARNIQETYICHHRKWRLHIVV